MSQHKTKVATTVYFLPEAKRDLLVRAAMTGVTMNELVERAVEQLLRQAQPGSVVTG